MTQLPTSASATAPAAPPNLWRDTCTEPQEHTPLRGDVTTDVAVIGGGFTGLSTALHLAQAGADVHLVEAGEIGTGASGRNVGLVNAGLWLPPQKIAARLGAQAGNALVDLLGKAPAQVFSLIEQHQIRCEAVRAGTIHAATSAKGLRDLQGRAVEWQRLGAPVQMLDRAQMRDRTGINTFLGGLFDARAGTVQPLGYARGLARAAIGAGALISTHSRVTALIPQDGGWRVDLAHGTLRARRVVLATNMLTGTVWPELDRCQSKVSYFQLASEPMADRIAHILPGGEGLWDTGTVMVSLRCDKAGRLILGSMGRIVKTGGLSVRWADRMLARLLPELGPVRWEAAWDGAIGTTPDKLPRIVQPAPGLYAPLGYNGRGIAPGTAFGKALAEMLTGTGALPLPLTPPEPLRAPYLTARARAAALLAHKAMRTVL